MKYARFIPDFPTHRPYPFDLERKQKVEKVMYQHDVKSVSQLARETGIKQQQLSAVINGTRLSRKTEERIAAFFGMRREELFIQRTLGEVAEMNRAQLEAKQNKNG